MNLSDCFFFTSGAIQQGVPTNVCLDFALDWSPPEASHADTPTLVNGNWMAVEFQKKISPPPPDPPIYQPCLMANVWQLNFKKNITHPPYIPNLVNCKWMEVNLKKKKLPPPSYPPSPPLGGEGGWVVTMSLLESKSDFRQLSYWEVGWG